MLAVNSCALLQVAQDQAKEGQTCIDIAHQLEYHCCHVTGSPWKNCWAVIGNRTHRKLLDIGKGTQRTTPRVRTFSLTSTMGWRVECHHHRFASSHAMAAESAAAATQASDRRQITIKGSKAWREDTNKASPTSSEDDNTDASSISESPGFRCACRTPNPARVAEARVAWALLLQSRSTTTQKNSDCPPLCPRPMGASPPMAATTFLPTKAASLCLRLGPWAGTPSWFQLPTDTHSWLYCPAPPTAKAASLKAWALGRDPQLAPIAHRGPQLALIARLRPSGQGHKPLAEAWALGRDPQLARITCKGPQLAPLEGSTPSQGLKPLAEAWALGRDPQLAPITCRDPQLAPLAKASSFCLRLGPWSRTPSWLQWPSSTPSQCRKPLAEARALDRDPQLAPIACRGPQLALITCGGPPLAPIFPSDLRLQYPSSNNCSPRLQPSWLEPQESWLNGRFTTKKEKERTNVEGLRYGGA
ncbi:hypothetical protein QTO34_000698 [Cnephaeus nilssonii]|uniref:Uncharacterized protein n=1 Tax=Cnephaeus nilssonii TaxID=3371016 RepID=A0AA40IC26_CNENI|nr:hypothetical protein QTO34_000698 [Eptesicus nilssonii]